MTNELENTSNNDIVSLAELNQSNNIDKYAEGVFYQTLAKTHKDMRQTQIVRKATEIEFKARQRCVEAANALQSLYWQQESLVEALIPSSTTSIKIADAVDVEKLVDQDYNLNIQIREASIKYKAALQTYKRLTGLDFKQ